jgi:hypothetical protein
MSKIVTLPTRHFVGLPLSQDKQSEIDIILGCIDLHQQVKLFMIPFLEIKTELDYPAPTTLAQFSGKDVLRLCGFIFEDESIANDFKKISKDLIKIQIEKCKYLTMTHEGPLEKKDDVWRSIFKELEEKELKVIATYTYEMYVVNQLHSTDPRDWKTEMYQPLL